MWGTQPYVRGDVDSALAAADHRLERSYTVAYIAHVPLEPRAAVARWSRDAHGEQLTVWTGTQRPFAVREQLAQALGLPAQRVRVIVPDTGSGYGGKHTGETAVEAARLAKAAGRPVKLVWTREEEFRWAYFRPAGVIDVTAGVRRDGTITAWRFDNYNSGAAAIRPMYAIENQRVTFHPSDSPLRQGSYRALAATANQFAREMHVDELAHLVGMDPLAFRLKNIRDPRLRAVLQAAAERFGWGKGTASGHGVGIAGGFEKGGYVATCAEVAVNGASSAVRIVRAVTAFDCGAIVNPDGLRNQVEGALIQGIGGALFEAIDFDNGVIRNATLSEYPVPRFGDVPDIDVVLIDRKDQPSFGAGEAPIMAIAPAVGAATFQATGVRPRSLPMARSGVPLTEATTGKR
jgi:isoquinoline 1-oxidoreductase